MAEIVREGTRRRRKRAAQIPVQILLEVGPPANASTATPAESMAAFDSTVELASQMRNDFMAQTLPGAAATGVALDEATQVTAPSPPVTEKPIEAVPSDPQVLSGELFSNREQAAAAALLEQQTTASEISVPEELVLPIGYKSTMQTAMEVNSEEF